MARTPYMERVKNSAEREILNLNEPSSEIKRLQKELEREQQLNRGRESINREIISDINTIKQLKAAIKIEKNKRNPYSKENLISKGRIIQGRLKDVEKKFEIIGKNLGIIPKVPLTQEQRNLKAQQNQMRLDSLMRGDAFKGRSLIYSTILPKKKSKKKQISKIPYNPFGLY